MNLPKVELTMTISTRHPTIEINRYRSADYPDRVDAALAKIESTPSGNHLLEGLKPLAAHGKKVLLNESPPWNPAPSAGAVFTDKQRRKYGERESEGEAAVELGLITKGRFCKGEGTNATVNWSPGVGLMVDSEGRPQGQSSEYAEQAFVGLAHELIHAKHIMSGDFKHGGDRLDPKSKSGKEELRATGLGKYASERVSENSIRAENGLPIRKHYAG
ncbi:type III secretion system effector protein [Xanthomonas campestris pv. campestris]|uniref:XopG/HopH/AvrPtoH family type III secretion system effector n=2 Tax=Xanthomonas campestris TaxID=339 RepID=UPI0013E8C8E2|nr:type III secretion system effector protein [Xanthomonas campestris]MCC5077987.1 type III secretion system effector protein [Xanthomonas campestris pv. campestris]MCF8811095.1 type III secretion system effector protein [Xanthomonas campestris pv. campestris]MDM7676399.1 type III secretion system effector protein [Xanthomonas campestris pv. campestris]MDM7680372.1 type III secretion system effector protein [Xanthomonas campestris pv. campestris]MDO0819805.1 type III secretion system effector 